MRHARAGLLPARAARMVVTCAMVIAAAAIARPAAAQRYFEMRVTDPRVPPLTPSLQNSLDRARALRESGRLDAARDTLVRLLAERPHHPQALAELAEVYESRRAWKALETLARSEREATRDSALLAAPLVTALERQGRNADAAGVVLEALIASPSTLDWASVTLDSLEPRDARAVRERVGRAADRLPARDDLARLAARFEWRAGDARSAMHRLAAAEVQGQAPLRWRFAEEMVRGGGSAGDSAAAVEALLDLAADRSRDAPSRGWAARRAWEISARLGHTAGDARRVAKALSDVPADRWGTDLVLPVMRALSAAGAGEESRGLLAELGQHGGAVPEIALEHATAELREGPPEKALPGLRALSDTLPEARFRYAEALFFAGQPESAAVWYGKVAEDPSAARAGAALERIYLIEDGRPRAALLSYGALAWQQWRGQNKSALALADSLVRGLEKGPLWAQASLTLASLLEATGDGKAALTPLMAVAEGLPEDRVAPLARQRAGDVLRVWYRDNGRALAQYEECLARYPKAWNTAEVRRWVEALRKERGL